MNTQLEELACLYVLDRLEPRERTAFETRLAQDPQLAAMVRQAEAALAQQVHALAQHEPPAEALARIEARLDQLPAGEILAPARSAAPWWSAVARWGIAAVIAIGVGAIAVRSLRQPAAERPYLLLVGFDSGQSTVTKLPMTERPQNADAGFIQLASLAERFWEKPEELPGKPSTTNQDGRGYALFDPGSNQGFIAIQQLPAAEQGMSYHLWVLDTASGQSREAGVLPLTGSNRGLYFFSLAPTDGKQTGRLDFFITAEGSGAPKTARPRGKVVLGDSRI
jgi:anti-sigma-K factor RskA